MASTKPRVKAADTADLTAGDLHTFALEYEEDQKTMRVAAAIAVVLHLILLVIHLPDIYSDVNAVAEKPKVYVMQQVRFKPPPPKKEQEIPEPRAKKVPIPDPTPDEPEPIRMPDEIEPEIDLPDTDMIFGIPDGPPPTEPAGPIHVGGDVKAPVKLHSPQPQYTEIARKARIQGVVIVQAIIDKTGSVTNVKVLKTLPMGLDQAAADAIKSWRFKPATLNGKPVAVYYTLTVNFTLQ